MLKFIFALFVLLNFNLYAGCSDSTEIKNINSKTENTKLNSNSNANIENITVTDMDGKTVKLSDYRGKVLLIVNVASQCGFTPQYEGLEAIYGKYKNRGFEILAFPSNDFGGQEPGSNEEIRTFCETKYNVTFPLFQKIPVLGENKNALYKVLTENSDPSGDIGWNFEKFIIDKNGNIAGRFKSKVKPESEEITGLIERELEK
ncbi:MAG: glutathione peroxidase [Bacteroidetes bacterium]|nr:glutathione peroxidase [Bacteroidota bacterium]